MFFRPKFCANCGVKIERAEWGLLTSRRFCQVCAIELKEHELLPKVAGVLLSVITITAVGIAFSSRQGKTDLMQLKSETSRSLPVDGTLAISPVAQVAARPANEIQPEIRTLASTSGLPKPVEKRPSVEVEEVPSFCAAETKKGTPCSRRVKGANRCYQHQGMPAMVIASKQDKKAQK